jgi:molybdopterin-synthase adenylyltransferase
MNSIRITSQQLEQLKSYLLADSKEAAAFLLAGFFKNEKGYHFTVRDVIIPKYSDYDDRTEYHIEVSAFFFNKVISIAEKNNLTIIQCHSHPFAEGEISYSGSDNHGESRSSETLYNCLNAKPMGSLLFGKNITTGRIWIAPGKKPVKVDELRIVDRHMKIEYLQQPLKNKIDIKTYDRQIRAFGIKGQELISGLTIGIIGLGGTGSSIAEQLAREGVTKFILVDHDKFEKSNKTRIYGSYEDTKNIFKVEIAKKNIAKIQPNAKIITLAKNVISQEILSKLRDCDIIFSCVDTHSSRSVINEIAYQLYIPVIDIGVGLNVGNEKIQGGFVRASLIGPTLPCLYCMGIINSERILSESLDKQERIKRQKEGYVTGLEDDAPSVIIFTTTAASFGLFLLKDLLFNIISTGAATLALDITDFRISRMVSTVRYDCVCLHRMGRGGYMPLSAP